MGIDLRSVLLYNHIYLKMCTVNMSKCLGKVKKSWLNQFKQFNRLTVTTVNLHFFLEPRERRDVGAFVGFQEAKHLQAEKKST